MLSTSFQHVLRFQQCWTKKQTTIFLWPEPKTNRRWIASGSSRVRYNTKESALKTILPWQLQISNKHASQETVGLNCKPKEFVPTCSAICVFRVESDSSQLSREECPVSGPNLHSSMTSSIDKVLTKFYRECLEFCKRLRTDDLVWKVIKTCPWMFLRCSTFYFFLHFYWNVPTMLCIWCGKFVLFILIRIIALNKIKSVYNL